MVISRNGVVITLTDEEVHRAWSQQQSEYLRDDLESRLDDMGWADEIDPALLSDDERKELLDRAYPVFESKWSNSEERGDLYWIIREQALVEVWRQMQAERVSDQEAIERPAQPDLIRFITEGEENAHFGLMRPDKTAICFCCGKMAAEGSYTTIQTGIPWGAITEYSREAKCTNLKK